MRKSKMFTRSLAVIASLGFAATSAHAAAYFTENFNGNVQPVNLEVTDYLRPIGGQSGTATFTNGQVEFVGLQGTYVRTVASDYNTVSFVAEVTATTTNSEAQTFLGLGTGEGGGDYGEPVTGPSIHYAGVWFHAARVDSVTSGGVFNNLEDADYEEGVGTHRYRMTYDHLAQTIFFEIDEDYTGGPFVADRTTGTYDTSALGFNGTNAHVFFGAAGSTNYDDLVISALVPEPASLALVGLGGLLMLRRRSRQ